LLRWLWSGTDIFGATQAYLVDDPRPVMIKGFFDNAFTTELRLAPRRKMVKISWVTEEGVIPA